jgi:hypothetical protein
MRTPEIGNKSRKRTPERRNAGQVRCPLRKDDDQEALPATANEGLPKEGGHEFGSKSRRNGVRGEV